MAVSPKEEVQMDDMERNDGADFEDDDDSEVDDDEGDEEENEGSF